nr:transposase (putative), gypsy type [Tanacetum cinerariifolium]
YPTNDGENVGKLQPKADIGIFIGYAPSKKAFRIYNRRTRRIVETIHFDFDELTAMASKQSSLGHALQEMTPATISSGLVQKPSSSTSYVLPTRNDWDLLFQPLFDELLNPPPSVDNKDAKVIALIAKVIPQVADDSTGSPSSTTVDQDSPSPNGKLCGEAEDFSSVSGNNALRRTLDRVCTDIRSSQGVAVDGDPVSENVSSPVEVGSLGSVYRPEWGVTNGSLFDTSEACQDLVDHAAPPGYFSELRHMHNEDFLGQYNINLARQVAMGSQLRLRFEQEAKLLRKSVAQVARGEQRIQARESEIKNLEAEECWAESRIGKDACPVLGTSGLQAAARPDGGTADQMVEQRCAEMDARLDALSIDFDEELYPHMLTAIAGRMWVIGHGLRLAMMKCAESLEMRQAFADVVSAGVAKGISEGLKHGVEHGHAQRTVESLE